MAVALQAFPSDHSQRGEFLSLNASLLDHPSDADYERETPVHGSIPFSVECVVAILWVSMVSSMPLVALRQESQAITRTQLASIMVMLCAFLGGILLFTNLLFFQSSHFDGIRSLTLVECVYLMAQVLTTVGYGDITPAKPRAQVFVALYVLFSLLLIANTVSDIANAFTEQMWEAHDENLERAKSGIRSLSPAGEMMMMTCKQCDLGHLRMTHWLCIACLHTRCHNCHGNLSTGSLQVGYSSSPWVLLSIQTTPVRRRLSGRAFTFQSSH